MFVQYKTERELLSLDAIRRLKRGNSLPLMPILSKKDGRIDMS